MNPNYNISEYMHPKGPVVGYGYDINGYLLVAVDKDLEKALMDYIYGMFDQQAQVKGIKEVLLVFERREVPHEDLLLREKNLPKTENNTNQQAETDQQKSKEKPNSIPGFSTMCRLSGLYLAYKIRH
jgi:hypothetical protein